MQQIKTTFSVKHNRRAYFRDFSSDDSKLTFLFSSFLSRKEREERESKSWGFLRVRVCIYQTYIERDEGGDGFR